MDANKMGAFIASIRKEKGMTQAELASKLFLSDKTISKWERGAGLPDIGNLEALAELRAACWQAWGLRERRSALSFLIFVKM